jgi:hypothetical protein
VRLSGKTVAKLAPNPPERNHMAQKEESNLVLNSLNWGMPPMMSAPLFALLAEFNGTLLESVAAAQKEWGDFVHRRIKEDVATWRQLMQCHSLADMHQVFSQYLTTAFEQSQNQSTKIVERVQSVARHLAEAPEGGKEQTRARH